MNKKVLTKTPNAIFLIIVLVAGTFAAISPSFMPGAQAEPYYDTDEYTKYAMNMVNESEDERSYANDGYGSEDGSYGNNNYHREYSSYQPDYKQDDRLYGYDEKYKSKDKETSNSISISKIKCENVNNNFNNNVIGNLSIGNSGRGGVASDDGTNGALNANAYGNNGERYNDGYNKKDKDFSCIINNNNTINNVIEGNETTPEVPLTCIECFEEFLTPAEFELIVSAIGSLDRFCDVVLPDLFESDLREFLEFRGIEGDSIDNLIECLLEAGIVFLPETSGFNTQGGVGSLASFDVHNGGTGDLTALEKIEKLKQQWLELLP